MSNYTVKVGLIHLPPAMELFGTDDNITLGGYFGEFFTVIFSLMNVSYQYIRISDNKFGSMNKITKKWNGMMKYLVDNNTQIGASLTQTRSRQNYVKFSPILYTSSYKLLYRNLDTLEWSYDFFLLPFQADVWAYVTTLSFIIILLAQYYKLRNTFFTILVKNRFCEFVRDLFLHLTLCWPIALLPVSISTDIMSSKIIFVCYYLFVLIVTINYNSVLTAILTVAKYSIPFQSLDDMVIETDYFPVIVEGRSIQEEFSTTEHEPWKSGWLKILANLPVSLVTTNEEGIDTAYAKKAAFVTTLDDVQTITHNCSFSFAPRSFGLLTDSVAYSNDFPYVEEFNKRIIQFGENGILRQLAYRYYIGNTLCTSVEKFKPVTRHKIVGVFLLYTLGVMASLIVCIIEIVLNKYSHSCISKRESQNDID